MVDASDDLNNVLFDGDPQPVPRNYSLTPPVVRDHNPAMVRWYMFDLPENTHTRPSECLINRRKRNHLHVRDDSSLWNELKADQSLRKQQIRRYRYRSQFELCFFSLGLCVHLDCRVEQVPEYIIDFAEMLRREKGYRYAGMAHSCYNVLSFSSRTCHHLPP